MKLTQNHIDHLNDQIQRGIITGSEIIDQQGQFIRMMWPDNEGYEGYIDAWFCRVCGEQVDDPYDPDCECNL